MWLVFKGGYYFFHRAPCAAVMIKLHALNHKSVLYTELDVASGTVSIEISGIQTLGFV